MITALGITALGITSLGITALEITAPVVQSGILLPESTLHSDFFAILAAFVAINTVMYAALAIAKIVPMVHLGDLVPGRRRRSETRSIHPHTSRDG